MTTRGINIIYINIDIMGGLIDDIINNNMILLE
jgi:hypothetical protein